MTHKPRAPVTDEYRSRAIGLAAQIRVLIDDYTALGREREATQHIANKIAIALADASLLRLESSQPDSAHHVATYEGPDGTGVGITSLQSASPQPEGDERNEYRRLEHDLANIIMLWSDTSAYKTAREILAAGFSRRALPEDALNAACESAHGYPATVHSKSCSWPACELDCKGRGHRQSGAAVLAKLEGKT